MQNQEKDVPTEAEDDVWNYVALNAYDLDAENLAEQGIAEAYAEILPELRIYVPNALSIEERMNHETGRYDVLAGSKVYRISPSPGNGGEYESWGFATFAFFDIVNSQLSSTGVKFYALNSGNDLEGVFLLPEQVRQAGASEVDSMYLPYIPTDMPPLFGQPVDGS